MELIEFALVMMLFAAVHWHCSTALHFADVFRAGVKVAAGNEIL